MAVRVKVCMSFIPYRTNCHKASNSPDAGMLKKLVRDRNCRPVLRGILEALLHYLTQVLPVRTAYNRPTEKPELEAAVQSVMSQPGQRTVVPKQQTRLEEKLAFDHFSQKDKLPARPDGDCTPRRLTTFQLLQSKFMRSIPKTPITHEREIGMLNCIRRMTDLKHGQGSNSIALKSQSRKEHGLKKTSSVKDLIAKFALAEKKETSESVVRKQSGQPKLISKGTVLSSLMAKFEDMVTQCKGSELNCMHENRSEEVQVANRMTTRVDNHKKKTQEREMQVKGKSTEVWLKGTVSPKRHQERPKHVEHATTKIQTNQEENGILAEKISTHQAKGERSLQPVRPQSSDKAIQRWTPEIGLIENLNYEHGETIKSECVIENQPPEPCRAVTQLVGELDVHVGIILNCSPLWSKCVHPCPNINSAEASGGLLKDHNGCCKSSDFTVEKTVAEDKNCVKNETIQRPLPKFLIPRVQRFSAQGDSLHQSEIGNINPLNAVQQFDTDDLTAFNTTEKVKPSSSNIASTASQTNTLQKEENTKEQQSIVSKYTDIPQSTRISDRMENNATFEDRDTPNVSPLMMNDDKNIQRRPKYTTINYGDSSVKQTYKSKTIRFTDTFTF